MSARARNIVRRLVHNDLPLGTVRLVFAVLTLVFSIVAGGLCLKIWTKHHTSEKLLNSNLPPGVSAVLEYQDVKTTSILLFVSNHLVTFTASHIVIIMLHDIFKIIPPFILRRIRLPQQPLSSVTLPYQAAALLVATTCLVIAGAFHTQFIFSRIGTVAVHEGGMEVPAMTIQATLDRLGIALPYRDVHYIRISAELPWPTVFFALGANVVTLAAWYQFRHPPIPNLEDSVTESVEVEKASELELGEEVKEKEMVLAV
ncbi:hypothetical protein MVEN_00250200 [Mycena venus]|uniref:Uncharacterized protein n=1 Tax=Mycena venus TaxID=2733690 RepID=A0A8H6YY63_9AGAR|nr:hypothetical protein MVEN_00250200 [Mycena venus]